MTWLRELSPHTLKIDGSLVAGLGADDAATTTVRAVLAMAEQLGITVTAEGVETPIQLAALRDLGCPQAQGNLLGPPTGATGVAGLLG